MQSGAIDSPCIKICILHPLHDICTGCGRSLQEIARWGRITADERRSIMAGLPARMRDKGLVPPKIQNT